MYLHKCFSLHSSFYTPIIPCSPLSFLTPNQKLICKVWFAQQTWEWARISAATDIIYPRTFSLWRSLPFLYPALVGRQRGGWRGIPRSLKFLLLFKSQREKFLFLSHSLHLHYPGIKYVWNYVSVYCHVDLYYLFSVLHVLRCCHVLFLLFMYY